LIHLSFKLKSNELLIYYTKITQTNQTAFTLPLQTGSTLSAGGVPMLQFGHNDQPKVLILYASYGDGHLQVARAIADAMKEQGNARTVMIDLMAESHPWLNELTRRFYRKSYTHMPSLYGWMYDFTRPMKHDSLFGGLLHSFGRDKIRRILDAERPDVVIHTFPSFALPELKKRGRPQPPSCAVVTDFDLHRRWVHPSIERYYVATEDMKTELVQLGIPDGNVQVSGIPLKGGFRSLLAASRVKSGSVFPASLALPARKAELFRRYGLEPELPVVLIMAGAEGCMPDLERICDSLLEEPGLQIALVCGRNAALQAEMEQAYSADPRFDRLNVYGFVEQMDELMTQSTCLLTKPGGVTLSEAIAAGLPMFAYRPVPGQEKQNALYLASKGALTIAYESDALINEIKGLLADPLRYAAMQTSVRQLQPAEPAADRLAMDILDRCLAWDSAVNI
jgi:processive 1,2-diacylglycerol beta-glucosyltransferase